MRRHITTAAATTIATTDNKGKLKKYLTKRKGVHALKCEHSPFLILMDPSLADHSTPCHSPFP